MDMKKYEKSGFDKFVSSTIKKIFIIFFSGFIFITVITSLVNVPPGHVGIMFNRLSGGIQNEPLGEGWHLQIPFLQTIYVMSIQTQKTEYPASAASKDLQIVNSHVAISYHIIPSEAPNVFKNLGEDFSDKIIAPAVQEEFKAATAKYNAEDLIQQREVVKNYVSEELQDIVSKYGIRIDEVSIVNFDFSPEFNSAIEAKVVAQQNKFTAENILAIKQVEAQQRIAEAEGIANSTVLQAQAQATAIIIQGNATAEALKAQREQVTPTLVALKQIEKWNGQMPNVLVGDNSNQALLINANLSN